MNQEGMNVLIIGGGAREHVLARIASLSPHVASIYCFTDNVGIRREQKFTDVPGFQPKTNEEFAAFAKAHDIDLTIVGPEQPLANGIVDHFRAEGLTIFGPTKSAARLESDKWWAKCAMREAGIPTAYASSFTNASAAVAYIDHHVQLSSGGNIVVKCAELAAGKGVIVCDSKTAAKTAIENLMVRKTIPGAGDTVLLEDFLIGDPKVKRAELSIIGLVDVYGHTLLLPAAQDYKPVGEGDTGENTGGMGSISPLPWLTPADKEKILSTIFDPITRYLENRGKPFSGALYAGLMKTADGFKVIEFNVRFGDPEIVAIFPLLRTDLIPILKKIADGESIEDEKIETTSQTSVCVVVADQEYPQAKKPRTISHQLVERDIGADVFIAGVRKEGRLYFSTGGRILDVVGTGCCPESARRMVYRHLELGPRSIGIRYREDIGRV